MRNSNRAELRLAQETWKHYNSSSGNIAVFVIDVEKVDYINPRILLTQVGMNIRSNVQGENSSKLFLIGENKRYRNRFCAVNHYNFAFAATNKDRGVISRQRDIKVTLTRIIKSLQEKHERIVLAGWDVASDIKWLRDGAQWVVPEEIKVLDLQAAYMAFYGTPTGRKPSLSTALAAAGIPYDPSHMHNAGNDAYYTGEMFLALGKAL